MCTRAYLLDEGEFHQSGWSDEDLEADADSFDIPTYCRVFRGASFDTRLRGDAYIFKSTSSNSPRTNQSRSTSFVRYESSTHSGQQGFRESRFGEVIFFFVVELPTESPYAHPTLDPDITYQVREKERGEARSRHENEVLLAFIRHFPVSKDGRLLYRAEKGKLKVILASDIRELVGLLRKGKREYIVRKNTALF